MNVNIYYNNSGQGNKSTCQNNDFHNQEENDKIYYQHTEENGKGRVYGKNNNELHYYDNNLLHPGLHTHARRIENNYEGRTCVNNSNAQRDNYFYGGNKVHSQYIEDKNNYNHDQSVGEYTYPGNCVQSQGGAQVFNTYTDDLSNECLQ